MILYRRETQLVKANRHKNNAKVARNSLQYCN